MLVQRLHHVAYRCLDARQTVEWYKKHLDMDFVLAIAEDQVPSTGAPDPYAHLSRHGPGNVLAFFRVAQQPDDGTRREHAELGTASGDEG